MANYKPEIKIIATPEIDTVYTKQVRDDSQYWYEYENNDYPHHIPQHGFEASNPVDPNYLVNKGEYQKQQVVNNGPQFSLYGERTTVLPPHPYPIGVGGAGSPIPVSTSTENKPKFKYSEDKILADLRDYVDSTYADNSHYLTDSNDDIQCLDVWLAREAATQTFVNTAIKYLWRYGRKEGNNKKDLMKALHYIMFALHNDHYKKG